MSLNQFMHHRNPYKKKKPNFKDLAIKYEDFRKHVTQDLSGNIHLDFKNAECQRALTATLLKEDFQLEVELPLDRLIPTVPQRLNYILWLEDIFQGKHDGLRGIDIGTGACCIYPLLACKKNSWSFLATEVDDINIHYANKNIAKNSLTDKIKVEKVADADLLVGVLGDGHESYDFCMCNPPFFGSLLESQGVLSTRTEERALPSSFSTASIGESVCHGGEVHFVKRIIQDSLKLRDRVRVYTSLVGKKSSLPALKAELRDKNITNFSTTQFSQGRTMRWAIAWSFDQHILLPKPVKKPCKKSKAKGPLEYIIPKSLTDVNYTVLSIGNRIRTILKELQIPHSLDKISASKVSLQVCARHDTWSHQRRKRRQLAREQQLKVKVARQEPAAAGATDSSGNGEADATESSGNSGDSKDESMEVDEENAKIQNTGTIEKEVEGPKEESRVEVCTDSNDSKNDVLKTESGKDTFHSNTHKPTIKGDNDDTELKGLETSKCELNSVAKMATSAQEEVGVSEHLSSSQLHSSLGENKKAEPSCGRDKNQNITSDTLTTLPSGGGDKNHSIALPSGDRDKEQNSTQPSGGGDNNQSVSLPSGGGDKNQNITSETLTTLPSGGGDKNHSIALPYGDRDEELNITQPSGGGDNNQSVSLPSGGGDKNQSIVLPSGGEDKHQSRALPSGGGDKNQSIALPSGSQDKNQQSDECVLKCTLNIKSSGEDVLLQMVWIDGMSQETMYQVLQHIKNKLNSK